MSQQPLRVNINGTTLTADTYDVTAPLSHTLREVFNLRGTKVACGQGNCGACTVHLRRPRDAAFVPVNACLVPTGALLEASGALVDDYDDGDDDEGRELVAVRTIESVAEDDPIAAALVEHNASQCGFCTPGFVMKAKAFAEGLNGAKAPLCDIEDALAGNLCRCTGYRPILYALKATLGDASEGRLANEAAHTPPCVVRGPRGDYADTYANGGVTSANVMYISEGPMGAAGPCKGKAKEGARGRAARGDAASRPRIAIGEPGAEAAPADGAKPEGVDTPASEPQSSEWNDLTDEAETSGSIPTPIPPVATDARWISPTRELAVSERIHALGAAACIVGGNVNSSFIPLGTRVGVTTFVSLGAVPTLSAIEALEGAVVVGANVTIARLIEWLRGRPNGEEAHANLIAHLRTIGNPQVRNLGTVVGNLVAARARVAPTDIGLIAAAAGATVQVVSMAPAMTVRSVPAYAYLNKNTEEGRAIDEARSWVRSVTIPLRAGLTYSRVGTRFENHPALSAVAYDALAGHFWCVGVKGSNADGTAGDVSNPIVNQWVVYGSTPTERLASAEAQLRIVFPGADTDPKLFASLRLLKGLCGRLLNVAGAPDNGTNPTTLLADRREEGSRGSQQFYINRAFSPITEPIIKPASYEQASGTAVYVQDHRPPQGCFHGSLVQATTSIVSFSPKALGDAMRVAVRALLRSEGKRTGDVFVHTAHDVASSDRLAPNANVLCDDVQFDSFSALGLPGGFGEFIFAPGYTSFAGQALAIILHRDEYESRRIARFMQDMIGRALSGALQWLSPDGTPVIKDMTNVPGLRIPTLEASIALAKASAEGIETDRSRAFAAAGGTNYHYLNAKGFNMMNGTTVARGTAASCAPGAKGAWMETFAVASEEGGVTYNAAGNIVATGRLSTGAQSHLYMETQSCTVTPEESRFLVQASTQTATALQGRLRAMVKGTAAADVVVSNCRIGGGFGGKEPQATPTAGAALTSAVILGAPVRVIAERTVDLELIGKRHALIGTYHVEVGRDGHLLSMDVDFAGDAGGGNESTYFVLELATLASDSMYEVPNFRCECRPYFTHKQPSTAFRSFGVVQSMTIIESAVEHALFAFNAHRARSEGLPAVPAAAFRERAFYRPTNDRPSRTPYRYNGATGRFDLYGQELLETGHMHGADGIWETLQRKRPDDLLVEGAGTSAAGDNGANMSYTEAVAAVEAFNANPANAYRKRGIAIMPLKYGIAFTGILFNQGSANVSVFSDDGSVLIQTAGVEMGQGLHTKIAQTAAAALDVPMGLIRIGPVSTDTAANGPGTGASVGGDLNLPALIDACLIIKARLTANQDAMLFEAIEAAIKGAEGAGTGSPLADLVAHHRLPEACAAYAAAGNAWAAEGYEAEWANVRAFINALALSLEPSLVAFKQSVEFPLLSSWAATDRRWRAMAPQDEDAAMCSTVDADDEDAQTAAAEWARVCRERDAAVASVLSAALKRSDTHLDSLAALVTLHSIAEASSAFAAAGAWGRDEHGHAAHWANVRAFFADCEASNAPPVVAFRTSAAAYGVAALWASADRRWPSAAALSGDAQTQWGAVCADRDEMVAAVARGAIKHADAFPASPLADLVAHHRLPEACAAYAAAGNAWAAEGYEDEWADVRDFFKAVAASQKGTNPQPITHHAFCDANTMPIAAYWAEADRKWISASDANARTLAETSAIWARACLHAYLRRVPLLAQGFSKPDADGGRPLDGNNLFFYYTYGAAWSMVEIDCLTGETDVLRTDVVYDAGLGTNPSSDVGQIEGGLVQGIGNMLTESVTYDAVTGRLNERTMLQYAIPDHRTIPRSMNVQLFWKEKAKERDNGAPVAPRAESKALPVSLSQVQKKRGKTTGEPPLILSVSVLNAARNAIMAARRQFGGADDFVAVSSPLTPQSVLAYIYGSGTQQ